MPEKKRKPEEDLLGYPRCALDYASISKEVFDTLIERGASEPAKDLALYFHFNLAVWTGNTHARAVADIARDLKYSVRTVYRAIAELTDLGIINELQDGYGARFHVRAFVPMRENAARRQRERAEEKVAIGLENWIATFKRKHGRSPSGRQRGEMETKLRRDFGID